VIVEASATPRGSSVFTAGGTLSYSSAQLLTSAFAQPAPYTLFGSKATGAATALATINYSINPFELDPPERTMLRPSGARTMSRPFGARAMTRSNT
jgi:hypothetical protein